MFYETIKVSGITLSIRFDPEDLMLQVKGESEHVPENLDEIDAVGIYWTPLSGCGGLIRDEYHQVSKGEPFIKEIDVNFGDRIGFEFLIFRGPWITGQERERGIELYEEGIKRLNF